MEEFHLEEAGSGKSFFRKKNVNRFIAHLSFNEATARVLSHFNFFCSFIALFNSLPFWSKSLSLSFCSLFWWEFVFDENPISFLKVRIKCVSTTSRSCPKLTCADYLTDGIYIYFSLVVMSLALHYKGTVTYLKWNLTWNRMW